MMMAGGGDDDLDLAFKLQLDEAIQASPESSDAAYAIALHAADLARAAHDSSVRVAAHDALFARELTAIPEDRWAHDGDDFQRPLDLDDPSSSSARRPLFFRVLFKGMASKDVVGPRVRDPGVAVLAAAVCGPQGEVLLRVQKVLEAMALMEGLHAALGLGIRRVQVVTDYNAATLRKCVRCRGSFCIRCKVPWHDKMTCYQYKRRYPHARPEDVKLQNLAKQRLWRQCIKCKHMIELAEGCYHMTCVCGYEFCYTCGKEWKEKKATCTCPLWEERNIIRHDGNGDVYYLDEEEEDYYDEEEDEYDVHYVEEGNISYNQSNSTTEAVLD
ncbi:hypothetical protein QOZ80_5BG0425500 [Eleusine coracana subsp. coracana]|nr:hypothetical protein QOZ80_5BG0425500 [Eleusine coracana subsp. coracana]